MMTIEEEINEFKRLTQLMADVYERKHRDYGQSTKDTYKKYGPISMLTRMTDKMNRLDNLIVNNHENLVSDESIDDTLMDLANYAIIFIIERNDFMQSLKRKESTDILFGSDLCGQERICHSNKNI